MRDQLSPNEPSSEMDQLTDRPEGSEFGPRNQLIPSLATFLGDRASHQTQNHHGSTLAENTSDPFGFAHYHTYRCFDDEDEVESHVTPIRVYTPGKETIFRTHPDPSYWNTAGVWVPTHLGETYLVDPRVWKDMGDCLEFTQKLLVTAVTRKGELFIWPIPLSGPDGKIDEWVRSAQEAAYEAKSSWVQIQPNMSSGAYDVVVARSTRAKPQFPPLSARKILRIAFQYQSISKSSRP